MNIGDEVGSIRKLSDERLLAKLSGLLGSSRKLAALVVAHLGEVDERRLHLLAGCESMFAYCTRRLGMSEDEACRRIEVARLARRFPVLLERLSSGRVSLSVAALLKARLTAGNHAALLDDVSQKTVRQAKEVLAAWFPQPDVLPSIRKLPERRAARSATNADASGGAPERFASPLLTLASSREAPETPAAAAGSDAGTLPPTREAVTGRAANVETSGVAAGSGFATSTHAGNPMPRRTQPNETPAAAGSASTGARSELASVAERPEIPSAAASAGAGTLAPTRAEVTRPAQNIEASGSATGSGLATAMPADRAVANRTEPLETPTAAGSGFAAAALACGDAPPRPPVAASSARGARSLFSIQPLSPARYKVVFTADAELKRKLELARDLLRHAVPNGDLATLVDRALDRLIETTLKRRFAKRAGTVPAPSTPSPERCTREAATPASADENHGSTDDLVPVNASVDVPAIRDGAGTVVRSDASDGQSLTQASDGSAHAVDADSCPPHVEPRQPARRPSRHLPNAVRRSALERDGLRCTWHGPDGTRCESRAWLEHDHIIPRGLGGTDDPANIRLRCRAHNQLAAEQACGQLTIARIIAQRRAHAHRPQDASSGMQTERQTNESPTSIAPGGASRG